MPLGGWGHRPAESGCGPTQGSTWGMEGRTPATAAPQPEGLWVVNSAGPTPPPPAEPRAPLVLPTAIATQGTVQVARPALPLGSLRLGLPAPRAGSHHLLV